MEDQVTLIYSFPYLFLLFLSHRGMHMRIGIYILGKLGRGTFSCNKDRKMSEQWMKEI